MFRLRHPRSREHLREHLREIELGVLRLGMGLVIEAEEEAARLVPGRLLDNTARRRLRASLTDRLDDLLGWIRQLAADPLTEPPPRTDPRKPVNPETQQLLTSAGIFAAIAYLAQTVLGDGWQKARDWLAARRTPADSAKLPPQVIPAAYHFAELRRHFSLTDQPQRVALMDDLLAAGVFACPACPAQDAEVVHDPRDLPAVAPATVRSEDMVK